ncbi:MAG: hypothetical protein J6U22_07815 [Bacteroidaceae bacterium]|nr:hypothetical protein [Bacteroidaceae bacterium]
MKKYIVLFSFVAALFVGACSPYTDEEPGGTAIQDLCGTWVLTPFASVNEYLGKLDLSKMKKEELDAVDDWDDLYGKGKVVMRTYNTANNDKDSLWFEDSSFWNEKFKIGCNYDELTFGSEKDSVDAVSGSGCKALIRYGQVLKGAATTPRGQKADSIVVYVFYNDNPYGFTFKFSGYRYTGFDADLE